MLPMIDSGGLGRSVSKSIGADSLPFATNVDAETLPHRLMKRLTSPGRVEDGLSVVFFEPEPLEEVVLA